MNRRVALLKEETLTTKPYISTERAELMTLFYQSGQGSFSAPMQRALAFKFLLENKAIYLGEGELIVGERGPAPKACPTYPELCCHSLEDLELLNSREKVPYAVSAETRRIYKEEIIPFWRGKSMRDRIFSRMSHEWLAAYEAGVFTEFMEQRAPGHTVLDDKIYRRGLLDFKQDIATSLASLDFLEDPDAYAKSEQLKAMSICVDAIIMYARRHAAAARALAQTETDPKRRAELERIADISTRVPARAPRDFWEALQAYWYVHLGVITELNTWDSFNPGRLDQHLYPFYRRGLEEGTLTRAQAKELLQCFWIKFNNQPAPPKVGVTAEESGTYTDFANINLGGLQPDGSDGVNELTYLILEVIDEMRLIQPSTNAQVSHKSPDRFLKAVCRVIRKGWGQPSIFNCDTIIAQLLRQGKSVQDARCGGASGCVEVGAFGKESYILTGYFNLVKMIELALNNGVDPRTGAQLGPATGDKFTSYDQVFTAFKQQLEHFIAIKIKGNNIIERMFAAYMPSPFLSVIIDDCIKKGQDYNDGGARYNTTYIQGVGLGSATDCLAAIKYQVFDQENLSLNQMLAALRNNFAGYEDIRQLLLNKTPKYGNDDVYADLILTSIFDAFYAAVEGRQNTKGGVYRINLLPTTCHVYFGSVIGATPDGRRAWQPLSEGISPVQGADRHGPTAVIKSAAKIDHIRTGGTLLNQKFSPQTLAGEEGIERLAQLVRSYFTLGGHHLQFNVVDGATLRAAQEEPDKHKDLIVRVAGYSDYFCDLNRDLQNEIIARTEHSVF